MVERVQLYEQHGKQRLRRWRTVRAYGSDSEHVEYGRLADGRWYSDSTRDMGGAHIYPATEQGERAALEHCYQRMRDTGREYVPVPAGYDATGEPTDDLPWERRGSDWVLPEPETGD